MSSHCDHVHQTLSEYYDGRLARKAAGPVEEHLARCETCRTEYEGYQALSKLMADTGSSHPPEQLAWETFAAKLDHVGPVVPAPGPGSRRAGIASRLLSVPFLPLAVAAGFLGLIALAAWIGQSDSQVASRSTNLEQFMVRFAHNPDEAQIELIAQYHGEPIETSEAAQRMGLPISTRATDEAPFRFTSLHQLRMPCCNCIEAVCVRPDGTKLAVFGHICENAARLGHGKEQQVECGGKTCRLVELPKSQYAVQWQAGNTRLLVVGARNQTEIEQLVAWLDPDLRNPVE